MQIKNIIFDFGGVLVDWNPKYMYSKVFEKELDMEYFLNNICTQDWNLQQDKGRSLNEATIELQKKHPRYHDLIQLYYQRWEEMLKEQIYENVELIAPLKEKFKLYGLTNWSAETFPLAYKRFPFFELFDGIVVSGEEKIIKPDPEIFNILLKRFQITARESVFIDDNINNIKAAEKLGFLTIHINNNMNLKTELGKINVL